jgi:hypothetical protein
MPLWALTTEAIGTLEAKLAAAQDTLAAIRRTTYTELWHKDLAAFDAVLDALDANNAAVAASTGGVSLNAYPSAPKPRRKK